MTLGSCGRYELLERIGAGGMAEVFRARRTDAAGLTGIVAIKRIHPALGDDERFAQMFLDEARLVMSLSHGNLVAVHELGEDRGQRFLVMEHVDGIDLDRLLRRRPGPLPVPVAVHVAAEILAGLDYAHRKRGPSGDLFGLVHRDVSPANVLLSREGGVKLADFGIAKAAVRANVLTGGGVLKGKLAYLSPEHARGEPLDPRSDVFALGLVLHEMLTGHRVYGLQDSHRLLALAMAAEVRPISELVAVPPELDRVVMRALARNPTDRHESAEAMRKELLAFLYRSGSDAAGAAEVGAVVREVTQAPAARAVALDGVLRAAIGQGESVTPTTASKTARHGGATPGTFSRRRLSVLALAVAAVALVSLALGSLALGFWPAARSAPAQRDRRQPSAVRAPAPPREAAPAAPREKAPAPPPAAPAIPAAAQGPAKAVPEPAAAPGILHLGARPWAYATVTRGGRAYATRRPTPIHDLRLPPGRYRIELDNPVKGLRAVETIQIRSGQSTTRVVELAAGSQ
ncbi:MAG: serine/threonine protein kinase [Deltaproteobacteria bacterium]|nr:serine/threonine protein kinase [Deltaproteobacteria bacterium]